MYDDIIISLSYKIDMTLIYMKEFLDDLVDSFYNVLDLEMTIINANPIVRISGTEKYNAAKKVNWNQSYTMKVIKNREPLIVIDTTTYKFNVKENSTKYHSLILYPIYFNDSVIGVIVVASFNKEQQELLKTKQKILLKYLKNIASLISSKYYQIKLYEQAASKNEQLQIVFNSVSDGLLLYSQDQGIIEINERAKCYLSSDGKEFTSDVYNKINQLSKEASSEKRIINNELNLNNHEPLVIEARPIGRKDNTVLFVINTLDDIQKVIIQNHSDKSSVDMISKNKYMLDLLDKAKKISNSNSNVLILGESGTGKEVLARAIHYSGNRKRNPFITVNCAAIPEALLESELFGYEEGAFTGAKKGGRIGKFLLANKGTIFLDEIGDMPLYLQAKLLRVLQDRKIDRIGSVKSIDIDIRVIAATNKDLYQMTCRKEFREDLYYRLCVIEFLIPPLRDRMEDIEILTNYFINKYNKILNKQIKSVSNDVLDLMKNYSWPGNVRELENSVEYMVNFETLDIITKNSIPHCLTHVNNIDGNYSEENSFNKMKFKDIISNYEKKVLLKMTAAYGEKVSTEDIKKMCNELGISVTTYYRKLSNNYYNK